MNIIFYNMGAYLRTKLREIKEDTKGIWIPIIWLISSTLWLILAITKFQCWCGGWFERREQNDNRIDYYYPKHCYRCDKCGKIYWRQMCCDF